MRALNILAALLAPGAGHVRAGHLRRGVFWVALLLVSVLAARWTPWILIALYLAQIVDAAVIREGDPPGPLVSLGFGLACYVLLVGGALLARSQWIEMFKSSSGSMMPTLVVGDHFAVDKTVHRARRGDVVVFRHPNEPDKDMVKRVVAVAGDTIEVRDEALLLDGKPVPHQEVAGGFGYRDPDGGELEPERGFDAYQEMLDGHRYVVIVDRASPAKSFGPVTVPAGSFFVLGDNRDNSADSRHFGCVPERNLKGRATYIW